MTAMYTYIMWHTFIEKILQNPCFQVYQAYTT